MNLSTETMHNDIKIMNHQKCENRKFSPLEPFCKIVTIRSRMRTPNLTLHVEWLYERQIQDSGGKKSEQDRNNYRRCKAVTASSLDGVVSGVLYVSPPCGAGRASFTVSGVPRSPVNAPAALALMRGL